MSFRRSPCPVQQKLIEACGVNIGERSNGVLLLLQQVGCGKDPLHGHYNYGTVERTLEGIEYVLNTSIRVENHPHIIRISTLTLSGLGPTDSRNAGVWIDR